MTIITQEQFDRIALPHALRIRSILGHTPHACRTNFATMRLLRIYILNQGKLQRAVDRFVHLQEKKNKNKIKPIQWK